MKTQDLVLLDPHEAQIRSLLTQGAGSERSAYMLFGIADIESDPWTAFASMLFAKSALIVPEAASLGSVLPIKSLFF